MSVICFFAGIDWGVEKGRRAFGCISGHFWGSWCRTRGELAWEWEVDSAQWVALTCFGVWGEGLAGGTAGL